MLTYHVIVPYLRLHSGVVSLSASQARARAHALKPLGGDLYALTAPVGFKCGETIGWDGEMSKVLAAQLEALIVDAVIESDHIQVGDLPTYHVPMAEPEPAELEAVPEPTPEPETPPEPVLAKHPFGRKPKGRG